MRQSLHNACVWGRCHGINHQTDFRKESQCLSLFCFACKLLSSQIWQNKEKKRKHSMSFSLGLHIKLISVVYRQQHGSFPSFKCFPVPATHQTETFSKQKPSTVKTCVSLLPATSVCRYLSYFLLLANLSLKGVSRGLLEMQKNLSSCPLSLCLSCKASYQQTLVNI